MSYAERSYSVDAKRNNIWDSEEAWRKRCGTTPSGVAVVSFRSVSPLGGKRVRNGSEVLCPDLDPVLFLSLKYGGVPE